MLQLKDLRKRSVGEKVTGGGPTILKESEGLRGRRAWFGGTEEPCRINRTIITYWLRMSRITCKWFGCCHIPESASQIGTGNRWKMRGERSRRRVERFQGVRDDPEKARSKAPPSNTKDGAPEIVLGVSSGPPVPHKTSSACLVLRSINHYFWHSAVPFEDFHALLRDLGV